MIVALVFMAMIGWGCWLWLRDPASPRVTAPVTAPARQAAGPRTAVGLEDDPARWHVTPSPWTALDDLQLLRLLMDAGPANPPSTIPPSTATSIDDAIHQCTQKDTT